MLNEEWQHMHCETPSNPTNWIPCPCAFRCDPGKCPLSKGGYRWFLRSDWVDHPDCDVAIWKLVPMISQHSRHYHWFWLHNCCTSIDSHMAVCQNLVPLVNIKIAGKWMFIPLKMVLIGIDSSPYIFCSCWVAVHISLEKHLIIPELKMASGYPGNRTMHAPADTLRGGRQLPQPHWNGSYRISGSFFGRFSSNVQRNLCKLSIEISIEVNFSE